VHYACRARGIGRRSLHAAISLNLLGGFAVYRDMQVPQFSLNLLGGFAVYRDMQPMVLPPSCQRVVALAALKRRPLRRSWVCATLWPHAPTRNAVANLRSALWRLRPTGADPLLTVDARSIGLAPRVSVDWHDAMDLLERLIGSPRADATPGLIADLLPPLQSGELLAGWADRWVLHDRGRYDAMLRTALNMPSPGREIEVAHYACGSAHGVLTIGSVLKTTTDPSEP
jgi:hypothetical protein